MVSTGDKIINNNRILSYEEFKIELIFYLLIEIIFGLK